MRKPIDVNLRLVTRQLAYLLLVLSLTILLTAAATVFIWRPVADDLSSWRAIYAMGAAVLLGMLVGCGLIAVSRGGDDYLGRREALLLVALSWIVGAALAGAPFRIWAMLNGLDHPFNSSVHCYFEAMSGLTTTGATVLSNIEAVPRGLLLWRAATHWLGGLGIVVLFVAVLPTLGVGGKKLFQVEAPGPKQQGVRPRIRETARLLWFIYLGLTVLQAVMLHLTGLEWFDAICITFATLATGGFSTQNASVGGFTLVTQTIIIGFMVLAGVNFGIYYQLIRRRFRAVYKDPELRFYLLIMLVGSLVVAGTLIEQEIVSSADGNPVLLPSLGGAVLHGVFQVVSIQTTTGFVSADFDQWSFTAKAVLVLLMFVGGCAGSTGGGIKVIRILMAGRVMIAEIERVFRPNVVRAVKVGGSAIDAETRQGVLVYVIGIMLIFGVGSIVIMMLEQGQDVSFITAATACAATLNNIGPGLARVGAIQNFGWFSEPSLIVMSLLMALGRLEVYALVVLISPRFWRSE